MLELQQILVGLDIMLNRLAIEKGMHCVNKAIDQSYLRSSDCGDHWVISPYKGKRPNLVIRIVPDMTLTLRLWNNSMTHKADTISSVVPLASPDMQSQIEHMLHILDNWTKRMENT